MGSNEEYLDKLLQSVTDEKKDIPEQKTEYSEDMTDEELLASLIDMYSDELAEFKTEEIIHRDNESINLDDSAEHQNDEVIITDVEESSSVVNLDEFDNQQNDLKDLLGDLQDLEEAVVEDAKVEQETTMNIMQPDNSGNQMMDADSIAALFAAMNQDEEVEEIVTETINTVPDEVNVGTMSEEQIDDLLNAVSASIEEAGSEMDLNDLFGGLNFTDDFDPDNKHGEEVADLLGGMLSQDDDLAEISELLQKADNNERVESNLDNLFQSDDEIGGNTLLNELLQAETINTENEIIDNPKKKKVKKKKEKKEKGEKESLWKKITSIMFEESDDLDLGKTAVITDGSMLIDSDENANILDELMNEDMQAGKKKKKDKKEKKKTAKGKAENEAGEEEGEVVDLKAQAKQEKEKKKAEKAAAKKKAKAEKQEADRAFLKAQPSISTKRAFVAVLFAASILGIILVIYFNVPGAIDKSSARKAFYNHDYYKAYELLIGKELNDSDTILLDKVTSVLKMQRKLDSYNNYVLLGKELEALNALVESVKLHDEEYSHIKALSLENEYDTIYDEMVIILKGKYHVTEDVVREINALEDDKQYTLRLTYIIEGKSIEQEGENEEESIMEDVLPEEEEFMK